MTGADKREHKRAAIPLLIQYRFSPFERYETDYSANISAGGLFIHCDQPQPMSRRSYSASSAMAHASSSPKGRSCVRPRAA